MELSVKKFWMFTVGLDLDLQEARMELILNKTLDQSIISDQISVMSIMAFWRHRSLKALSLCLRLLP